MYALVDPTTKKVCYVGKTEQTIKDRLYRHVAAARYGRASEVSQWMRGLLDRELRPTVVLLEQVTLAEADQAEVDWILDFKSQGIELLNQTEGGLGSTGFKHTEESLNKVRVARAKQNFTPEMIEKRAAKLRGIPRPLKVRNKIGNGQRASWDKLTEEDENEIATKYLSGKYTQAQLGESYGVHQTRISQVVRNQER